MTTHSFDREFVESLRPILDSGDFDRVAHHIEKYWPNPVLREMLSCENEDAAKVALFCLSLTGTGEDGSAVAGLLKHDDPFMSKLAENTLWSIWFRAGGDSGNGLLRRAIQMVGQDQLNEARALLSRLIDLLPDFAEAYHQRAIVDFLLGSYALARHDLLRTLRHNPSHFAAMAGLGHCYAATGKLEKALSWYDRAAAIHPRAEGIQQAIEELNQLFDSYLTADTRARPARKR